MFFENSPLDLAPAYAKAAWEIRNILTDMNVGDRLIPERLLCIQLGVSRVTLRRALEPFHRAGTLRASRGGGTWLARPMEPLRKERTISNRFIGLVVPSVENSLIARILRGAEAYATESSFHVALAHDHGDLALQIAQLERMATGGVQGIAVYPDTSNINRPEFHSAIQKIHDQSIPLVMIDRYLPEIETLSVLSDNFIGMYSATQHMILTGHRRLTLLAFGAESGTADGERRRGFLTALQDYGIDPNSVLMADLGTRDHEVSAREIVKGQLTSHAGKLAFDGIVCMQDNMAYGAYLALREHGLDVPQDVALIGYDNLNSELFRANGLELSSVDQPAELIGSETARLLINLIENHQLDRPRHILLKPSLVLRTSCTATS